MIRKCDFCDRDMKCDTCDQDGVSPRDHWHTCDTDCATRIHELARPLETPVQWRQRKNQVRPAKLSAREFEYFLCDPCLAHLNEHNEIGVDDMCETCRSHLLLREDDAAMKFLRAMRIRL